jgi:hypothetical protein
MHIFTTRENTGTYSSLFLSRFPFFFLSKILIVFLLREYYSCSPFVCCFILFPLLGVEGEDTDAHSR